MIYRDEEYAAETRIAQLEAAIAEVEGAIAAVPPRPFLVRWRWPLVIVLTLGAASLFTEILGKGTMTEKCETSQP